MRDKKNVRIKGVRLRRTSEPVNGTAGEWRALYIRCVYSFDASLGNPDVLSYMLYGYACLACAGVSEWYAWYVV